MKLKVTVQGVAYEVEVEVLDAGEDLMPASPLPPLQIAPSASQLPPSYGGQPPPRPQAPSRPSGPASGAGGQVVSPIAGTVVEIKCKAGDAISENQVLLVLEAMKMNTSVSAAVAGKVKAVSVAVGDAVTEGQKLVELE